MSTPIKRLEIIKYAIELEDDDIIQSQLARLKSEAFDDELQGIVTALEGKNYTRAMAAITAWLQSQRAVTQWRDPQMAASKLELKALEERLRELIDRRNARVQQLDEFNDLYFSRLGPLMQQILSLRKTLAELNLRRQQAEARRREEDYRRCQQYTAQAVEVLATLTQRWRDLPAESVQAADARKQLQQQSNLIANLLAEALELETGLTREEEPARQARDQANEEFEKYREQHHDVEVRLRKGKALSEEDRNELKRLWRQASKLCHPDLVADDRKEEANAIMVQLNQAKQRGDVKAIRSLVARLQHGFEPLMASDRLNDLERIRKRIAQVREQIDTLVNELAELEKEESWLLVSSLNNMEAYFAQQEKALHDVRASLEHQVSEAQVDAAA
ncbi:DNA repair protein [Atlantibacter subterranea]|uniref:DNA repair protein n=1 Tax=Atlantibacter subterraneus TaxID=255519 RepID=A0A427UWE8_9ENTR|nr:DNA repair protein [Atlantibacter subterranea]MDA3132433.1 DNA repair protein [Atlantibacter subterranea]RSB59826.1 DNA repair protein [Atlantibacter subterranea]RSE03801.1 DNA repair protein [Atlantibacter subterranea]RSE24811.1 DNA repair protein [Atlantibacter subterranea]